MFDWLDGVASWVWLVFIFLGVTMLIAAIYFRQQSRRLKTVIAELYQLNEHCQQDALDFFDSAWPQLKQVGCIGLNAQIDWFGEASTVTLGKEITANAYTRDCSVEVDDMRFSMVVWLDREASQADSVSSIVLTTFMQILQQDLYLKQAEILTSQKRLERYQMFVQHEIKNISQFIQLLAEQMSYAQTDEKKLRLINRISDSMPMMARRARRTVEQMQQPIDELFDYESVDLILLINDVIQMYDLPANIKGSGTTVLPKELLAEVFKNILGNYRDHDVTQQSLGIVIEASNKDLEQKCLTVVIKSQLKSDEIVRAERMFEPFWSSSESGMGLGLFLARELLKQVGGKVEFKVDKLNNLGVFVVSLPHEPY